MIAWRIKYVFAELPEATHPTPRIRGCIIERQHESSEGFWTALIYLLVLNPIPVWGMASLDWGLPVKHMKTLAFCRKKWLSNAKSMTRNTQRQNLSSKYYKNTVEGLTTSSNNLPNRPKYLGYLEISSHLVFVLRAIIYPKRRRQRHIPITREIRAWNQKVDLAKPKVLGIRAYRGLLINACCMMWVPDYLFTKPNLAN